MEEEWRVYCALYPEHDHAERRLHPIYYRNTHPEPTWVRPGDLPVEVARTKFESALAHWARENPDSAAEVLARGPVWNFDYREGVAGEAGTGMPCL